MTVVAAAPGKLLFATGISLPELDRAFDTGLDVDGRVDEAPTPTRDFDAGPDDDVSDPAGEVVARAFALLPSLERAAIVFRSFDAVLTTGGEESSSLLPKG